MLGSKSLQVSMHKNASEPLTAGGGGILTVHSACRMARWVYKGDKQYQCKMSLPQPKRSQILQNASQFQENDTIYVPFTEVERFVNEVLDGVSTSIVVISGDLRNEPIFSNTAISKLKYEKKMADLKNKRIIFIFDECHRSQFGETHNRIKDFFNNAQMFGFTGTPIFAENAVGNASGKRTTRELFDDCLLISRGDQLFWLQCGTDTD